jgi:hypothetical protein
MADTQEQSLGTITPVDGDYFRAVDDPGGSPASSNVTGTALKAYLKTHNDTLYYGVANVAFTTANFDSTADTTLNNIPGLSHTLASGGKYRFKATLFVTNNSAGGTKVAISGTATATVVKYRARFYGAGGVNIGKATALDEAEGETAGHHLAEIDGYIEVNQGGTLTVQAAQNASNATATTVLTGSWIEVEDIT